ncbi:MAG: tRNA (adenosine(37)-N6)-threonylcarbamoyltransferase complex transferase subunit TsaD, partial [Gammaproteobacteria bacterium]|nr:tRNA (adenosine(37)-N6)-threonylcarbamoyltransferase complex transferase subunit TsaD [Gammaproteobacteria bacterium]
GANRLLRDALDKATRARNARLYVPALEYCTDNGVMIAYAGALRLLHGQQDQSVSDVLPRWSLETLPTI